jgi:hypothetical protein
MQEKAVDFISTFNEQALLADGFEDAFLGMSEVFGRPSLATYDRDKCIEILMERDGMTDEDAVEYFDFNVAGSWVGGSSPIYLTLWNKDEQVGS